MNGQGICVDKFLRNAFDIKLHLSEFLQIPQSSLEERLKSSLKDMSSLHPGNFESNDAINFYENMVGNTHLLELASWHLGSSEYIADTLRLQEMFAKGSVLDFGGGIGTHAIAAALMPEVEHVFFVDLNPSNREFVNQRAESLGLANRISIFRDLESISNVQFDTIICLDVLEHLPDPSSQLLKFLGILSDHSVALLNWYFFKGHNGEYPFHFDDKQLVEEFFLTLQQNFLEVFHPYLITTRAYKPNL